MAADPIPSFNDIVRRHAAERPDAVFVHSIDQDKSLTYGALGRLADAIAGFLAARGIGANDRVLLLAENAVEFHAAFVGVLYRGATIVTVNVDMNAAHLGEIVAAVEPRLVLYQAGLGVERLAGGPEPWLELGQWADTGGSGFFAAVARHGGAAAPAVAAPGDAGVIFYTSGTVAKPKGVIQTHAAAYYNYDATADYLGLVPGVRLFDCRSHAWLSAQHMSLGAPLVAGATAVIARKFSSHRYLEWLQRHDIDIGFVVPTMINMLLATPQSLGGADLPRLKFLTCSSAPLFLEPWRRFEESFAITLCQSGGSSEGGNTAAHRGARRKIGTLGPPIKYQTLRFIDDAGRDVAPGALGEILVCGGKQQAMGYLTPEGAIERLPSDGHHTGDLGRLDEDGHLVILGRKKELIIRGGVNIAPLEIDAVLYELPGVAEAAAAGVPDPIYGEEVAGFVALEPGAALSGDGVLAHCRQRLPGFKAPKSILFLAELPKNARGKVDRRALVEAWQAEHAPAH